MKIVVLGGGLSPERDVSLCTGVQVCNALRSAGQQAILVDLFFGVDSVPENIEEAFRFEGLLPPLPVKPQVPDLAAIRATRPDSGLGGIGKNVLPLCKAADIVFMAFHGSPGENGMIQAMFDVMEIKYTGAGYLGSALAMDKGVSKELFLQHNIRTPKSKLFPPKDSADIDFPLPCIVKPCSGGSSICVTKVNSREALREAAAAAFGCGERVLVEEFIAGRELTCGTLGDMALPVAEVIPKGEFYDYAHKYQDGLITELIPAPIPEALTREVQETALRVCSCLQLSVYSRVDFMYDGKDLYCLEANTLPGLTPTSHLPQQAKAAGLDYPSLVMKIIVLSMEKYETNHA